MALEEENHKLVEKLKLKESCIDGLKKLFRTTTGLEVRKFNILYEYLDPG